METPYLPRAIFEKDFEKVYEPAEDTFILLDALENDLTYLNQRAFVCLECGSGSGTVITAISKSLIDPSSRTMFATDINVDACKTTKKCADYHKQHNIQVVRTDLAESLVDRLENGVDLLIFNPPYVPTASDETNTRTTNQIQLSWAGGESGRQIIDRFLIYVTRLISKPHGVAYLVALGENNIQELLNVLSDHSIRGTIVMQRRAGLESLYVIKYTCT